jgi:hypothetical protein
VSPDRKGAFTAGSLYLVAMLAGLLSVVPVLEEPDYLVRLASSGDQLLRGAFFQLLMAPAYVGIALALYPLLKRHDEGLALGFVGSSRERSRSSAPSACRSSCCSGERIRGPGPPIPSTSRPLVDCCGKDETS